MPATVTALTASRRIKDRYYLELDGGAEKLTITINQIADHSLFTGRELTDEELAALREDASRASARASALRILGERNLSLKEITDKLISKGVGEDAARETGKWLEDIGAINDAEYAGLIVRHYAAKGYGLSRVKNELYRRGIPRELWEDALLELSGTEEAAYRQLCAKLGGDKPDRARLKKATDALFRRGFSWDDIKSAVERYENEIGDD